jgi:RimJ/RimL family protein N-acetyltransferase
LRAKVIHKPIEGERVRLRLLTQADIEMTRRWRNQDNVRKWFVYSDIIQSDQQRDWFAKYQKIENDYVYVVEERVLNEWKPAGQISLYAIDWQKGTAEYGRIMAGDEARAGKGLFFDASLLMMQFWHASHGISDFFLEVKSDNVRARKLYDKLGFVEESEKDGVVAMRRVLAPIAAVAPAATVVPVANAAAVSSIR